MALYLLHFDPPYRHAAHYLGWTDDPNPARRIDRHIRGRGSPLIAAALAAGSQITLVRTWPDGDRHLERKLKTGGGSSRLCPLCRPARLAQRRARRAQKALQTPGRPGPTPNPTPPAETAQTAAERASAAIRAAPAPNKAEMRKRRDT